MYNSTDWKDHVVERPKTYMVTENPDGSETLVDAMGETIQQGTQMSAIHFNNMEQGILDVSASLDALYSFVMMMIGHSRVEVTARAADAADKLATARNIGITGGATGAGVAFDGSAAINIVVTALDESKISSAVAVARGGTGANNAAGARANLGAVSEIQFITLMIAVDYYRSAQQMVQRDHESRLTTVEAQIAELT